MAKCTRNSPSVESEQSSISSEENPNAVATELSLPVEIRPATQLVVDHHSWLQKHGDLIIASGKVCCAHTTIAIHSDYGPKSQDKPTNQDYAIVWSGYREKSDRPCFGIAVGDGLTSSYQSDQASQLACSVALRSLVESMLSNPGSTKQALENATGAALQALVIQAKEFEQDPPASCPPGQFISTWKYILRQGKLLQTTLTLAWLEDNRLHAAIVGDSGLIWRTYQPLESAIAANCDLATQDVNALGPAARNPVQFDSFFEKEFRPPFLTAIFTDGIGRGLGNNPLRLLDELERQPTTDDLNKAKCYIDNCIANAPVAHDDNLTLVEIESRDGNRN